MKKKLVALALASTMVAGALAGCGSSSSTDTTSTDTAATTEDSTETAATGSGKVYLLNFKPEADEAWQDLADVYEEQTGVPVTVLTAASGEYNSTLQSEMAKTDAPTIFNVGNTDAAKTWDDYCIDMTDTALYDHLTDKSLVVSYNGKVSAVANSYETYGIIYNKTILETYCSLDNAVISSADDINSFDTLKAVADDIQARLDEINEAGGYELTGAFTSAGLDSGSSWRFSGHLANLPLYYEFLDDGCDLIAGEETIDGTYLDQFKQVWDLYITDSGANAATLASGSYNAEQEFGMEEAVFFQNGNWEYSSLTDDANGYLVTSEDLGMLPIYFGVDDENQGLCSGTENYWAINAKASDEDIQASKDFLEWVITSDEDRDSITNAMGLTAPFDTFTGEYESSNPFFQDANALMAAGKTSVAWSFNATPNVDDWRADVTSALTAYSDGSGDWSAVEDAFVNGWATQWQLAHEE